MVFVGMIRYFTLIADPIHLIPGVTFAGLTIFAVTGVYAHDTISIHRQKNIEPGLSEIEMSVLTSPNFILCYP
jgi:hypothetical protein